MKWAWESIDTNNDSFNVIKASIQLGENNILELAGLIPNDADLGEIVRRLWWDKEKKVGHECAE